ncbi:glycoprotein endo-alpha-1,2-mannosidase [Pimephales promelas]|uniref:glycoprotein endo-alpha-1,2-mannosidase n=1 Tax=Pimephales promelas TaxID=90988 RepID=UPI001955AC49|nr:glycoprotein endo-alpha-1,2-mannosidase [Pimephales promelas]KAG1972988.1 glycoprotein endo-alpha-1,2-mannosidase [Pimephales promelas]
MARFRRKSCFALIALALAVFIITVILKSLSPEDNNFAGQFTLRLIPPPREMEKDTMVVVSAKPVQMMQAEKPDSLDNKMQDFPEPNYNVQDFPKPNYNVHAFYYVWYGNPQFDGKYVHWDHQLLPHWDPKVASGYPTGQHQPPNDIGANFYPALGPYSSRDPSVLEEHMRQLRTAAVGVLAVSWYPRSMNDDNGEEIDNLMPLILDAADKYQLKVVFHIEPYKGRDDANMRENIKYIVERYGNHPAFYRYKTSTGKFLPLYYIYDSYLQTPDVWAELLKPNGISTIRDTPYDGIFIGLLVEEKHKKDIKTSGFDGLYTYFATNGFTYGSSNHNWRSIKTFCDYNDLVFIPSIGPGYIDTSIRPWNAQNTRNRINGKYYENAFKAAVEARPQMISITSFNEWHEGTQIEKAVPKTWGKTVYLDYLPHKPTVYLELTQKWANKFSEEQKKWLE